MNKTVRNVQNNKLSFCWLQTPHSFASELPCHRLERRPTQMSNQYEGPVPSGPYTKLWGKDKYSDVAVRLFSDAADGKVSEFVCTIHPCVHSAGSASCV